MEELVVLVDENDVVVGSMEKQEAHIKAVLHRAFSVFLFDQDGKMLLQQRSATKYHSPMLWTNACCSHPRINETYEEAAHRRLGEELGIDTHLQELLSFIYKADVGQGLTEHELDHVFIGRFDGEFKLNKDEVHTVKFMDMDELKTDIELHPELYTVWFKIIFEKVYDFIKA